MRTEGWALQILITNRNSDPYCQEWKAIRDREKLQLKLFARSLRQDTSGHSFTTQLVLLCLIISLICHQNHLTCIFLIPTSTFIWCLCARLFGCEARWNPSISKPFISKLNFNIFFFKKGNNLLIQKPISPLHASEAMTRGWVCSLPSAVPKTSRIATIAPSEGRLQYWHVRVIPWAPDHIRGWN